MYSNLKNMVYKIGFSIVLLVTFIVGTIWVFNHINAWIGIAIGFIGVIYTADKIYSFIKKKYKQ